MSAPSSPLALVTGGAGFVGSHLAAALLARRWRVRVLDDLSAGRRENLAGLRGAPGFRCAVVDVASAAALEPWMEGVDRVFHLAGVVGVRRLARDPTRALWGNLRPAETVLAAAARRRVPTLLASSSEVYGCGPVPFCEETPLAPWTGDPPRGAYARAKAAAERRALDHAHRDGLPVVVARLFNTVGPRQSPSGGMVLPRFAAQALRGEALTVYGDGGQTRCFAHVEEVASCLADLLESPAARGTVVNVGSDREVTVAELAERVRLHAASDSPVQRLPYSAVFPAGFVDPPRRVPRLDRLQRLLGRVPNRSLDRIIRDVLADVSLGPGRRGVPVPSSLPPSA